MRMFLGGGVVEPSVGRDALDDPSRADRCGVCV